MPTPLQIDIDPAEAGFDAQRLTRIDARFDRYVAEGKLPGYLVAVTRGGQLAHVHAHGHRDMEAALPVEHDTVFRIFSMTKPITSVAAMMLHEEGAFELKDPIERWLPEFADMRVYRQGGAMAMDTAPATEPIRVWHLMTHTAGLTYGFNHAHPVDEAYRAAGYEWATPEGHDLAKACETFASMPLLFEPGSEWAYSVATDVLGRLVEVVSGRTLAEFFAERILDPLGMVDTGFGLPEDKRDRLAAIYIPGADRKAVRFDPLGAVSTTQPSLLSGGAGLVSTAADYLRFADMLRRRGAYDGGRLLGSRTVDFMARNHLPGNADLEAFGRPLFSETTFTGVGYGLAGSVTLDPVANKVNGSPGEWGWGGAASTAYWVDPVEDITVVFLTQLLPSSTWPIRSELKALVHQALVD